MGLSVWCSDQAGPFQTIPQPGQSWQPEGKPAYHREQRRHAQNGPVQADLVEPWEIGRLEGVEEPH